MFGRIFAHARREIRQQLAARFDQRDFDLIRPDGLIVARNAAEQIAQFADGLTTGISTAHNRVRQQPRAFNRIDGNIGQFERRDDAIAQRLRILDRF